YVRAVSSTPLMVYAALVTSVPPLIVVNAGAIKTIKSATMPRTISNSTNVKPRMVLRSHSLVRTAWSIIDDLSPRLSQTGRGSVKRNGGSSCAFRYARREMLGANILGVNSNHKIGELQLRRFEAAQNVEALVPSVLGPSNPGNRRYQNRA